MKKLIFSFLLFSLGFGINAQEHSLKVIVEGVEEQKGTIYLSLHDNEESFPSDNDKAVNTGQITGFNSTAEYTFKNLKKGVYAVSIFQDLNGNKEMDTNFIGIPKEPVGASNLTSFGRPKFSKCKFDLDGDLTIRIEYIN
ncbi:DUF2141 domain-containing protein [Psychroflexus sp. CAK8W]|uniref:DUF2141 domain-containing protein n=1 Tax=Psychroflexus longus TaxID=2873596 RepID=A0ABS7XK17_9FLAO|nr:DUF2141 domain-containing protein [Psychroflexus longus]MBZ9778744.1 DUF2141 domain-containing protein [Psychroflexus longus]